MEKATQQFAINKVDLREQVQRDEPECLSLEQLEFVAGGDDGVIETPTKGWNTPQ